MKKKKITNIEELINYFINNLFNGDTIEEIVDESIYNFVFDVINKKLNFEGFYPYFITVESSIKEIEILDKYKIYPLDTGDGDGDRFIFILENLDNENEKYVLLVNDTNDIALSSPKDVEEIKYLLSYSGEIEEYNDIRKELDGYIANKEEKMNFINFIFKIKKYPEESSFNKITDLINFTDKLLEYMESIHSQYEIDLQQIFDNFLRKAYGIDFKQFKKKPENKIIFDFLDYFEENFLEKVKNEYQYDYEQDKYLDNLKRILLFDEFKEEKWSEIEPIIDIEKTSLEIDDKEINFNLIEDKENEDIYLGFTLEDHENLRSFKILILGNDFKNIIESGAVNSDFFTKIDAYNIKFVKGLPLIC